MSTLDGVLLVNLGTPEAPTRAAVARYLREFLSDPKVVDLPRWLWLPLLYGVIVPLRSRRSAANYARIWTPQGSPLLANSKALTAALAESLGPQTRVALAMRYGNPNISAGLQELRGAGVSRLVLLPVYPQYSETTTGTVLDALQAALKQLAWAPEVRTLRDYHLSKAWVAAVAATIRRFQAEHGRGERLLFSLHGIPQRYVAEGDPYADQCRASVQAIADQLQLADDGWQLTFQSRVGREPWLQPYTDQTLKALAAAGLRHVQVVCPGFAVDCLETLEEIALQNAELFREAGGEKLDYIPALNASPAHVEVLAGLVRQALDTEP